tara:strand:+ start:590 stop:1033 length:444 start_codon:yes stop_codon:yes gene_type:complete
MKHLLIILSILLLSSTIFGDSHKLFRFDSFLDGRSSLSIINYGETLYGWGEYPYYVWKGFGDKETHPKYKGKVENGVPNGLGYLIYPNGSRYLGSWKKGKMNGQGSFTYPNGEKYVGEWKNSKFWNVTGKDIDGNIIGKVVNGELQE